MIDLYELKQRLKTQWAKLDHVIIAAVIVSGVVDMTYSNLFTVAPCLTVTSGVFCCRSHSLEFAARLSL